MTTSLEWHATTQVVPPLSLSLGVQEPTSPTKSRLYGESNSRSLEYLRRPARSATAPASPNETPISSGASTPLRPTLVRKKSGQLVKSSLKLPSLVRTKSLPNTKNVHFAAQESLVDIRRFNRTERPASVSLSESDPSDSEDDDEDEWEMRTPNFQAPRYEGAERPDVYLETVVLSRDIVRGSVLVRNLGFEKRVVVRYTTNFWSTVNEIEGVYTSDIRLRDSRAGFDRFEFDLPLKALPLCRNSYNATPVFFAIRYTVNHKELWDNNRGMNYELSFKSIQDEDEELGQYHFTQQSKQQQSSGAPKLSRVPSFLSEEPAGIPVLQKEATNPFKSRYSFGSALSSPRFGEQKRPSVDGNYQDILDRYCFYTPKHTSPATAAATTTTAAAATNKQAPTLLPSQLPTPAHTPPLTTDGGRSGINHGSVKSYYF